MNTCGRKGKKGSSGGREGEVLPRGGNKIVPDVQEREEKGERGWEVEREFKKKSIELYTPLLICRGEG